MNNELDNVKNILNKSINAEIFINDCSNNGFEFISNNSDGVILESSIGRIIFNVLPSYSKTNIHTLTYFDIKTGKGTWLVDNCSIR